VKRAILIVLVALPLIAGAAFAGSMGEGIGFGGPGGHGGRRGPGGHGGPGILNPRILHQLNITDAQREQIHTLVEANRTANQALHDQLRQNHEAVRAASLTTTFDEGQVRALIAAGEAIRTDLALSEARLTSQIYSLLTPEQRTQLAEILANGPKFGEGRRGGR
jgi:protein CpxP